MADARPRPFGPPAGLTIGRGLAHGRLLLATLALLVVLPLAGSAGAQEVAVGQVEVGPVIATFMREGVRHIFIGPDHILFVLALVLLGGPLWSQVRIITAFTISHSVTLTLATLGLVELPSRLVESVIALSIVAVGLHDLRHVQRSGGSAGPAGRDPRPALAFGFGLVHGFGFASVLGELDLPREALGWSLAAFNLGVEIGQVAIVLVAAPILLAVRRLAPAPVARGLLTAAAGGVVGIGALWFFERAVLGA